MIAQVESSRAELAELCRKHRVKRLELFGSAASATDFDPARSDLDFLVEYLPLDPVRHAQAYLGLLRDLEALFERTVDLVETRAIRNP